MGKSEQRNAALAELDAQELSAAQKVLEKLDLRADVEAAEKLVDALSDAGLLHEHVEYRISPKYMQALFDADPRAGKYIIASSNGEVRCDETGLVVGLSGDWEPIFQNGEPTGIPLKFDLQEYQDYWGVFERVLAPSV